MSIVVIVVFRVLHLSGRQALLISARGKIPFFASISKDNGPAMSLCDSQWSARIAVDYWQIAPWRATPRKMEINLKKGRTKRITINHEDNKKHVADSIHRLSYETCIDGSCNKCLRFIYHLCTITVIKFQVTITINRQRSKLVARYILRQVLLKVNFKFAIISKVKYN